MTELADAQKHIEAYFDAGEFVAELAQLVAHPTESQKPDSLPHLHGYLDDQIAPMLEKLGCTTTKIDNPINGKGPFLIGSRLENSGLPTILLYGHGDVIRGQSGAWQKGTAPFSITIEGDRIYGRGTADNKGQHLINLAALRCVLQQRGELGFNLKVLIEMGEETGSPGLRELCQAHADLLAADALIASDGPRLQPDTPTVFTGSRGALNFTLRVNLREGAHHSGNFGGLLADPAIILTQALACITDKSGQIQIPAWRPTSLTPEVSTLLARLPIGGADSAGPAINPDWGEAGLTPAERAFGWNSFAILAMKSGVPEAPVNAIAGCATAHCQLRFVVGTEPEAILPALRQHLDQNGFQKVEIEPHEEGFFPATRLPIDHPLLGFVARSLQDTTGKSPHVLPNLAGSLPNDCFTDVLGLPTVWIPHSYAGCSQHAPNEHILQSTTRDALRCMVGVYWSLAGAPQQIFSK